MKYRRSETEQKKAILDLVASSSTKLGSFALEASMEEPSSSLKMKWESKLYASKSGKRLFVPLNKDFSYSGLQIEEDEDRKMDFVRRNGRVSSITVELELPDSYLIENMPESATESTDYGMIRTEITFDEGIIKYHRYLEIKPLNSPAEEYNAIKKFYDVIRKIDKPMVVLVQKKN